MNEKQNMIEAYRSRHGGHQETSDAAIWALLNRMPEALRKEYLAAEIKLDSRPHTNGESFAGMTNRENDNADRV